jgi:hypothetical protein
VPIDVQHHVPAITAVAASGSAVRDILLPTKGDATIAAIPTLDVDLHLIIEHREARIPQTGWKSREQRRAAL